jgi:hypothetical protein
MKRNTWLLSCLAGCVLGACAGKLENPERFETGYGTAVAASDYDAGPEGRPTRDAGDCDFPQLMAARCASAGCHDASSKAANLDLASEGLRDRLADAPASAACPDHVQVDPEKPENSLIYLKVTDAPPCGARMPYGGTLSDDEQACMLAWLAQ